MFETPIFQTVTFQNKSFIVKRDDLTHPIISGNKAYKFYWLVQRLPNASDIKTIISYGGSQSNAMLALAQIAAAFNCRFEYWSRPLPKHVRGNLQGNLKQALSLGMHLIESQNITQAHLLAYYQLSNENKLNNNKKLCLITQGGANHLASIGFEVCASHIKHYLQQAKLKSASVIVPSGTGVSAFYLQQYLKHCNIVATACVGGQNYLTAQMRKLTTEVSPILPTVLAAKKYFGHCDPSYLEIFQQLKGQTGITFELLYDPLSWQILLAHYNVLTKPIIYLHCGGVSGNETMLNRYRYYGMLD